MPDLLAAEDTWINTFYAEWQLRQPDGTGRTKHRFKWDWWHQRDAQLSSLGPLGRNGRETSGFVGLIDKIDGVFRVGCRWRSCLALKANSSANRPFPWPERRRRSWDGIGSLLVRFPVMRGFRA